MSDGRIDFWCVARPDHARPGKRGRQVALWIAVAACVCFAAGSARAITLEQPVAKGWNLLAVPLHPVDASPALVFGDVSEPLRVYRHAPDGVTVPSGEPGFQSVAPGVAYWILAPQAATLRVEGVIPSLQGSFEIPIRRGWNAIGTPWPSPVQWSSDRIAVVNGGNTLGLADAVGAGWIRGELKSYSNTGGSYQTVLQDDAGPESLMPWKGYLFYANAPGTLRMTPPSSSANPPLAEIHHPADGAELTGPTAVIGTAEDTDLAQYILDYAEVGSADYVTLAVGHAAISNATLGVFDPTVLVNGLYRLRLRAIDLRGVSLTVTSDVTVTGNQKPGLFSLSFMDLEVPLPGITLRLTRTYDSRNKRKGDFGVGWTSEFSDVKVRENGIIGEDWEGYATGGGFGQFCVEPLRKHLVTVTLPDGDVETFEILPNPACAQLVPLVSTRVAAYARHETTSQLRILSNVNVTVLGSFPGPIELVDDNTFNALDPSRYELTTRDGVVLVIDEVKGLESMTDPWGNTLTIRHDGIDHSTGRSIAFERDEHDRITRVQDPDGRIVRYEYDDRGDLVSHTDPMGNVTRFVYGPNHLLVSVLDPLGRMAVRNEYDESGRLVASTDARGHRTEFEADLDAQEQVVRDPLGNVARFRYDDDGNITREERIVTIDDATPILIVKYSQYDNKGNPIAETDEDGVTRTWAYNAAGNNTEIVADPGGLHLVTRAAYNAQGNPVSMTDPAGRVTEVEYHAGGCCGGLVSAIKDPSGAVTRFTYDTQGRTASSEDPLGTMTFFDHDSLGNVIREEIRSATGYRWSLKSFTYDASGRKLSETVYRNIYGASEALTTTYAYDLSGRITAVTDPRGFATRKEYDAAGRLTAEFDRNGVRTGYVYDESGNTIRMVFADGTAEASAYDGKNNLIAETDRLRNVTRYEYDELGRRIRTIRPDGSVERTYYTPGGRIAAEVDGNGHRTDFEYDSAGRLVRLIAPEVWDASSGVNRRPETRYEYDASGRRTAVIDANNRRTEYEYDARGNLTQTRFADGTRFEMEYNAAGQVTARTDEQGFTVRYRYDPLGRLAGIVNPAHLPGEATAVTAYAYDETGNLIRATDANGRSTLQSFDRSGYLIGRTLPLGMSETALVDGEGLVRAATDFNGHAFTQIYNSNQRITEIRYPGGSEEFYTYNATGRRQTAGVGADVMLYHYDPRNRLTLTSFADGSFIHYDYDFEGNVVKREIASGSAVYEYDALNRLIEVRAPGGDRTRYGYDAVGNRIFAALPNGVTTTYEYDARYRLRRLTSRNSAGDVLSSYEYTVGPAGNRTGVLEHTGRSVEYEYDSRYRLLEERINDPISGAKEIVYTYDAVGNRLTKSEGGFLTQYSYDANDRLIEEWTGATKAALGKGGALEGLVPIAPGSLHFIRGIGLSLAAGVLLLLLWIVCRPLRGAPAPGAWLIHPFVARAACVLLIPALLVSVEMILAVDAEASLAAQIESLTATRTFDYDANGNLLSVSDGGSANTYVYDFRNRLTEAVIESGPGQGTVRYRYDVDGNRTGRDHDGVETRYLVDMNFEHAQVLEEVSGGTVKSYVHGDDLVSMKVNGGSGRYYIYDGQLSTRQLTDSSGAVTDTLTYDAFGRILSRTGATPNDYGYTGEAFDSVTGLLYLRARHYDPDRGRFMTRDPFAGLLQDPTTLHKYLYAHNNPINMIDPSGMFASLVSLMVSFVISSYTRAIGAVRTVKAYCTAETTLKSVGYYLFFIGIVIGLLFHPGAGAGYVVSSYNPVATKSYDIKKAELRFHPYKKRSPSLLVDIRFEMVDGMRFVFTVDLINPAKSKFSVGENHVLWEGTACRVEFCKIELTYRGNWPKASEVSSWEGFGGYNYLSLALAITILKNIKISFPILSFSPGGLNWFDGSNSTAGT